MSKHKATLNWNRAGADFDYKSYSRNHSWEFKDEVTLEASAASQFLGDPSKVDPEDAFVASLSSCHMLTFLAICSRKGIVVESYLDEAVGFLDENDAGSLVITRVELNPKTIFGDGVKVSLEELHELHEQSHHECFLANSVRSVITTNIEQAT